MSHARLLAPLRRGPIALLWGGLALSAIGDQLYTVALTWVAVGVFGAAAGYLTALSAVVVLAVALLAGAHADQWDQRRLMIGADVLRAFVLVIVVSVWAATGAPQAWSLIAAVVLLAGAQALFQPALQAVLPGLVSDVSLLPASNALLDSTDRIARLLGPGLIALLGGFIPVMHFFSLDAASFAVSAIAVTLISCHVAADPRPAGREGVIASIVRGFGTVRRHVLLGFTLSITGVLNGTWYAAFFLGIPLLIEQRGITGPGGSGLGAYGLVIASYGCTNLLATLVVGSRTLPARPGGQMFGGTMIGGLGIVLLGLAAAAPLGPAVLLALFAAFAALTAIGGPMKDIPLAVLRQTELPRRDLPAAMRAFLVSANAGLLAAMLVAPLAFETLGVPLTLLVCGATNLAIGVLGVWKFR
jgi:MFS family permease